MEIILIKIVSLFNSFEYIILFNCPFYKYFKENIIKRYFIKIRKNF